MCPVSRCRRGLRRDPSGSALPIIPQSVSRGTRFSRLHWFAFATACQVARPPGRIGPSFPGPPGTFTSRLPAGRSPFPPLDMTTTATGLLCWRDFHPQEWQLASLHRIYSGSRPWTQVHARWLSNLSFEHPAQYLVLREYRQAIDDAETRLERLTQQVAEVVGSWSMAPVVEAYQSMRGARSAFTCALVGPPGPTREGPPFRTRGSCLPKPSSATTDAAAENSSAGNSGKARRLERKRRPAT